MSKIELCNEDGSVGGHFRLNIGLKSLCSDVSTSCHLVFLNLSDKEMTKRRFFKGYLLPVKLLLKEVDIFQFILVRKSFHLSSYLKYILKKAQRNNPAFRFLKLWTDQCP